MVFGGVIGEIDTFLFFVVVTGTRGVHIAQLVLEALSVYNVRIKEVIVTYVFEALTLRLLRPQNHFSHIIFILVTAIQELA